MVLEKILVFIALKSFEAQPVGRLKISSKNQDFISGL